MLLNMSHSVNLFVNQFRTLNQREFKLLQSNQFPLLAALQITKPYS